MHDKQQSEPRLQATFSISRHGPSSRRQREDHQSLGDSFSRRGREGGGEEVERRLARMRDFALSGKGELIARINRSEISHVRYENAQRSRARATPSRDRNCRAYPAFMTMAGRTRAIVRVKIGTSGRS